MFREKPYTKCAECIEGSRLKCKKCIGELVDTLGRRKGHDVASHNHKSKSSRVLTEPNHCAIQEVKNF